MRKILTTVIIITIIFGCGTHKAQFEGVPFEKHLSLDEKGLIKKRLESFTYYFKNNLETIGMLILKDEKILYEYGDIEEVSYIASCRKKNYRFKSNHERRLG